MNVALRGDEGDAREIVEAAGGRIVEADAAAVVIASGESAFLSAAAERSSPPILPVDAGIGRYGVPSERLPAAIETVLSDAYRTVDHPVLSIDAGDDRADRAFTDVSLMTAEPAHISEYAVRVGGVVVDRFRADGVVVATPAGSEGYARAAGGPRIAPGTGLAVVPVSPYATDFDSWVVRPDVVLTVERDDTAVSLFADDREVGRVDPHDPITVSPTGDLTLVRPPSAPVD
jgi:NAD+ kinase